MLQIARIVGTKVAADSVLRDKEQIVVIVRELGVGLRGGGKDCRRVAVSGPTKRHETGETSETGIPFLLFLGLFETLGKRKSAINRPNHKGYGSLAQEEGKGTRQDRCDWKNPQHEIELTCNNPVSYPSLSMTIEGKREWIAN